MTATNTELTPLDRTAVSVVSMLEQAKSWLSTAVETTGPAEIAMVKAQVVMAETYSRELQLSKDIQQDAQEMVRRAEYALGKAIRKGQAEGAILQRGEVRTAGFGEDRGQTRNFDKASPKDFAPSHELVGVHGGGGIYAMVDGTTDDQFEEAISEAKAEGNISRANVARKVKQQASPTTRNQRADLIEELAAQGYSSRQMPAKVGVSEETVRQIARDSGIEIPADRSMSRTRRINSTDVVVQTATALEGLVMGVELIDYAAVDSATASQWVDSLSNSLRVLNRFRKQIEETTQ